MRPVLPIATRGGRWVPAGFHPFRARLLPAAVPVVLFGLAAASVGCGGGGDGERGCRDPDFDGFGPGCEAGDDCDPDHAGRTDDCDRVPEPDCDADRFATGCPCIVGARQRCFDGPASAEGVASCRAGLRFCLPGIATWGLCEGQVVPGGERCDQVDNDCDGRSDEGVRSPCGGCDPTCLGSPWGEEELPFAPPADEDLVLLVDGSLTLARDPVAVSDTVWVPSSDDALVSRVDAASARVTAQYATAGGEPSRVAVDYDGDAWVATRAFGGQSTVLKIAGARARCQDRDDDGLIATSAGVGDVLPAGTDECVLFEVPVGAPGGVARALAIDGSIGVEGERGGQVWVGLHGEERVLELDSETGEVVDEVAVPGLRPYAAAFDPFGTLWVSSRDGRLARIDRRRRPRVAEVQQVPFACFLTYGMAVDLRGRVYLSAFSCDGVHRFDPGTGQWSFIRTEESVRGAAIGGSRRAPEDQELWVAHTGGLLSRVSLDPFRVVETVDLFAGGARPVESIGVGVDAAGAVWVASTAGGPGGTGLATRVARDASGSEPVVTHVAVGLGPHVQGDLTGSDLSGGFRREGRVRQVFGGCQPGGATRWMRVHLDFDAGSAGRVILRGRHAPRRDALGEADFVLLGEVPAEPAPFELSDEAFPDGGAVELELTLRTAARDGAPRVRLVGLEWRCPGPR